MTGPVRRALHRRRYVRAYARRLAARGREVADLRTQVADLRGVLEQRLNRTAAELEHALWFITSRGLRPEYETEAAARRRADIERAREDA
jgi:hypothetical protein